MRHSSKERFCAKIKVGDQDQCWEWNGCKNVHGYGFFHLEKLTTAHRSSWTLFKGNIPDGMWVLHKCDNRSCVNPSHLFLGTAKENTGDMFQKNRNRNPKGEELPQAILTACQVKKCKELYATGDFTYRGIAKMFGVHPVTIGDIIRGDTWTHV